MFQNKTWHLIIFLFLCMGYFRFTLAQSDSAGYVVELIDEDVKRLDSLRVSERQHVDTCWGPIKSVDEILIGLSKNRTEAENLLKEANSSFTDSGLMCVLVYDEPNFKVIFRDEFSSERLKNRLLYIRRFYPQALLVEREDKPKPDARNETKE